jgi:ribosomal protein S12 methylthiotransferase accessory factor YcaO
MMKTLIGDESPSYDTASLKLIGSDRTVSAEVTLERIWGTACDLGVTRLADITGLDCVGIPTYSAVVPASCDRISVYSGKGARAADAKVGALMEAVERQTVLRARPLIVEGSFRELQKRHLVVDPRRMNHQLQTGYTEDQIYCWVFGTELLSKEQVLVPAKFAGYMWNDVPHPSCFQWNTTNGMAAGNTWDEAVAQGLCELIERDAWALAEIGAHILPRVRDRLVNGLCGSPIDDLCMFPVLVLEHHELFERFIEAGIRPVAHDITSELGVPTVFVSVLDDRLPNLPMVHAGLGCHLDGCSAVRRALTEAAQSRCVDIQGAREDLESAEVGGTMMNLHTRRARCVDHGLWYTSECGLRRNLEVQESTKLSWWILLPTERHSRSFV